MTSKSSNILVLVSLTLILVSIAFLAWKHTEPKAATPPASSAISTHAASDDWILLSQSTEGATYKTRGESVDVTDDQIGVHALTAIVQVEDADQNFQYYRVGIYQTDCDAGLGKLGIFNAKTNKTSSETFAKNGTSVASEIATTLCGVMERVLQARQKAGGTP